MKETLDRGQFISSSFFTGLLQQTYERLTTTYNSEAIVMTTGNSWKPLIKLVNCQNSMTPIKVNNLSMCGLCIMI